MSRPAAEAVVTVALLILSVWLSSRIAGKAGLPRWWALAAILPGTHVILFWVIAFSEWPAAVAQAIPAYRDDGLHRCPQCSAVYDPGDYRTDVTSIQCSACGGVLPT